MEEDEDYEATLSEVGWFVVEIIERMTKLGYSPWEVCEVLDLPSTDHLLYMVQRANEERKKLYDELS